MAELCHDGGGRITDAIMETYAVGQADVELENHRGTVEVDEEDIEVPEENREVLKQRARKVHLVVLASCDQRSGPKPKQFCMAGAEAKTGAGAKSNFGWLVPEPKRFRWWSRSLKLGFPFHSPSLWVERVVQIIQCFSVFRGSNRGSRRS